MNSVSRAAKMIRDIIYRRPRLEHVNNLVSLKPFERRAVSKWKRFVTINCFLITSTQLQMFSCRF